MELKAEMIRVFKKRPGNRSVVVFMIGLAGTLAIPFAGNATSFRVVHIFDAATLSAIQEDRQVKIRLDMLTDILTYVPISSPPFQRGARRIWLGRKVAISGNATTSITATTIRIK